MHPFELDWRKGYKQLTGILKQANITYELTGNIEKDVEICTVITEKMLKNPSIKIDQFDYLSKQSWYTLYSAVCQSLMYKKYGKIIYNIDDKLSTLLFNASFKGNIPASMISFPKTPFFILYPLDETLFTYFLFFSTTNDGVRYLSISDNCTPDTNYFQIQLFDNFTIEECFNYSVEQYTALYGENKEACNMAKQLFSYILNTLLYILGDKDVIKELHPGMNPKKKHIEHRDPIYGKRPLVYIVGNKYRKLIERYELDGSAPYNGNGGSGNTVKPHVRMAHYHIYKTGPGRTIPIVKFLMTILVKGGGTINFTDMDPDITDVK